MNNPNPNYLSPPNLNKRPHPLTDLTTMSPQKRPKPHPPTHVPLKILCHASQVSAFIGKSGTTIKTLQTQTNSKIRIMEDTLSPGSDLRVISVISNNLKEAAVRVFEKLLEVSGENENGTTVVFCRVLVDEKQAKLVIGKGGKSVEMIRKESFGAKVSVLLGSKLPNGVTPPNEVVEIEGDSLSVKKALILVCGCLQEGIQVETNSVKETNPVVSISQPAVQDMGFEAPLHLTRVSRVTKSPSPAIVGRPSSLEVHRGVVSDLTSSRMQEVVFKILCSTDATGGVIGRGGVIIRSLQEETGARIVIGETLPDCDERLITITSKEDVEAKYSPAQRAVVLVFSRSVEVGVEKGLDSGSGKGSSVVARLVVQSSQVGCLLGKGGAIVSEMRKATGAGISILRGDKVPKCASADEEVVEISGQFVNVQDALYEVTSRVRSNLFPSKVINALGNRMNPAVNMDSRLLDRIGDPSANNLRHSSGVHGSIGGQLAVQRGFDHLPHHHHQQQQQPSVNPHSMGVLGGRDLPHPHRSRYSSSPGFCTQEISAEENCRTLLNYGRDFPSANGDVKVGSAHGPAIVTNTTMEILVPESAISSLYGENESNLARIRQISGAKVTVHELQPEAQGRTVIISGTPDETQAAQSLLHAFILTGPS